MALPTTDPNTWTQSLDLPSRLFGTGGDDYELYEEDDAFVLSVEMPGFDPAEIDVNWYDGRLNVAAEHVDEGRGRKRTYHRTFRLPKDVDEDAIEAAYENGVLEVTLPIRAGEVEKGVSIEVQ
jgi:HSP20 family protein